MSFKGWLVLLLVYGLYLVLGGFIFRAGESPDCEAKIETLKLKNKIRARVRILTETLEKDDLEGFLLLLLDLDQAFNLTSPKHFYLDLIEANNDDFDNDVQDCFTWNFYNSIFFSFTAVTTIGYGHLAPKTDWGKGATILYSLIGVPLNGILIGALANFFTSLVKRVIDNPDKKRHSVPHNHRLRRLIYFLEELVTFMVPGVAVFLLIPACVFMSAEGWTYLDSLYYAFVTLTTIGFGDYVAGRDQVILNGMGHWDVVYEIGLVVWIVFGLGYIFMVINVIAENLQKPARKAAMKMRQAEKAMAAKILHEIIDMKLKAGVISEDGTIVPTQDPGNTSDSDTRSDQREGGPPPILTIGSGDESSDLDGGGRSINSPRRHPVIRGAGFFVDPPTIQENLLTSVVCEVEEDAPTEATPLRRFRQRVASRLSRLNSRPDRTPSLRRQQSRPVAVPGAGSTLRKVNLPQLLSQTTLEEFLKAAEKVEREEEREEADDDIEEEDNRKSNLLKRVGSSRLRKKSTKKKRSLRKTNSSLAAIGSLLEEWRNGSQKEEVDEN